MIFIFTSNTHGVANRRRVQQVLDSYAYRIGRDTWEAKLSADGVEQVRLALRRVARRGLSVLCRQVEGFSRKQVNIAFVIGGRGDYGPGYAFPVRRQAIREKRYNFPESRRIRYIERLARLSGYAHDLGKNTRMFQEKLRTQAKVSDPIRHEAISVLLMRKQGGIHGETLASVIDEDWRRSVHKTESVQEWVVASHHRMPEAPSSLGYSGCGIGNELKNGVHYHKGKELPDSIKETCSDADHQMVIPNLTVTDAPEIDPVFSAFYARTALIMADHWVSGLSLEECADRSALKAKVLRILNRPSATASIANSTQRQNLENHLQAVGMMSGVFARFLLSDRLRRVLPTTEDALSGIAGTDGRFAWQSRAVDFLREKNPEGSPCLIWLHAATGSGKTLACASLCDVLGGASGARATVTTGLRTLTLQTGEVYKRQVHLRADQLSVVIGDRVIQDIHRKSNQTNSTILPDEDAHERILYEMDHEDSWHDLPAWLSDLFDGPGEQNFLTAPVLVCTLDQIIRAVDMQRTGYLLPMLRLMSAPIVLDEVDSYDIHDIYVIQRLFFFAGMIGQSIIASSATPYPAMSYHLSKAWRDGMAMRSKSLNLADKTTPVGWLSHIPDSFAWIDWDGGKDGFLSRQSDCARIQKNEDDRSLAHLQVDYVEAVDGEAAQRQIILDGMKKLHNRTSFMDNDSGLQVSAGMIRFARVRHVNSFAKWLAGCSDPDIGWVIVPYHSRNTLIGRTLLERELDVLLSRTEGNDGLLQHHLFREKIRQYKDMGKTSVSLVVVCSPVEEVGRDHDFDWAIIDPSSTRSVIQCMGRVLRHRRSDPSLSAVTRVSLLRKPYCRFTKTSQGILYHRPGFETPENTGQFARHQHDLQSLLENRRIPQPSWCLIPDLPLPDMENRVMDEMLGKHGKYLSDAEYAATMTAGLFTKHPFRLGKTEKMWWISDRFGKRKFSDMQDIQDVSGKFVLRTDEYLRPEQDIFSGRPFWDACESLCYEWYDRDMDKRFLKQFLRFSVPENDTRWDVYPWYGLVQKD